MFPPPCRVAEAPGYLLGRSSRNVSSVYCRLCVVTKRARASLQEKAVTSNSRSCIYFRKASAFLLEAIHVVATTQLQQAPASPWLDSCPDPPLCLKEEVVRVWQGRARLAGEFLLERVTSGQQGRMHQCTAVVVPLRHHQRWLRAVSL